jgi:hypothetical protein
MNDVTWDLFQQGFRTAHISPGVMGLKKREFRNLRKGNRSIEEYIDVFNNLPIYGPNDVNTDATR